MSRKILSDRPIYPSSRAFVLRFHAEADVAAGRCLGRIEQVTSGESTRFESLEELLDFLRARTRLADGGPDAE